MQKVVMFSGLDIAAQLEDYMDDNSETVIALTSVNNDGDEYVLAVMDDGQ